MGCFKLRKERERRQAQVKKMQSEKKVKAAIKIQSHVRRRMAIKATEARRELLAKELEGGPGTPNNEGKEKTGKSGESAGRRKRRVMTEGSRQRDAANTVMGMQGLAAFEAGGMLVEPQPSEQRRKSFGASQSLKVRKTPRPKTEALLANRRPELTG